MKVYLSGVISNGGTLSKLDVERNLDTFAAYREYHQAEHNIVIDPTTILLPGGTWEGYMRATLTLLLQADAIHMLPGWHNSKGACIEFALAKALGMHILGVV